MRSLLAFLLVVLALPAAAQDIPDKCEIENATSPYEIAPTVGYDHDKFGPSPTGLVSEFGVFISSFDDDDDDDGDGQPDFRAVPEWVAYEIKAFTQDANGQFEKPEGIKRNKWYRHSDLAFLWSSPGIKAGLDHSYSGVGIDLDRTPLNEQHMKAMARRIWNVHRTAYDDSSSTEFPEALLDHFVDGAMKTRFQIAKPRLLARILVDELERARQRGSSYRAPDDIENLFLNTAERIAEDLEL